MKLRKRIILRALWWALPRACWLWGHRIVMDSPISLPRCAWCPWRISPLEWQLFLDEMEIPDPANRPR